MIYVTYEEYKNKYYETQLHYNAILNEKEEIFAITQPKGVNLKKEKVNGGVAANTFDEYLIKKEKKNIDQRLDEIKSILEDRKKLLKLKEEELRESKNIQDKIYKYKYLDRLSVTKISKLVNYTDRQVYRILKLINKNIRK